MLGHVKGKVPCGQLCLQCPGDHCGTAFRETQHSPRHVIRLFPVTVWDLHYMSVQI